MIGAISGETANRVEIQNQHQRLFVNSDFAAAFTGASEVTGTKPSSTVPIAAPKAIAGATAPSAAAPFVAAPPAQPIVLTLGQQQTLEQDKITGLTVQPGVPSGGASGRDYGGAWLAPGAPPGQLFPTLYPQLLPNGQPDFNAAHAIADTLYANDYYANPRGFDPVAEQAKYRGMTDDQIMAAYLPGEMAFLSSQCDATGKPLPPPPGANTDPATGLPYKA